MNKKYLLTIFFIINTSFAYAKSAIYYVDIDFILNNSKPGLKIIKDLENNKKKNDSELKKLKEGVKSKNDEINKSKNLISDNEMKSKIEELRKQIKIYEKKQAEYANEFNKKQNKLFADLMIKINDILKVYMEKNSIEIFLNKKIILMAKTDLNLTDEILDIVNKEID